jgi:hypothetical protein
MIISPPKKKKSTFPNVGVDDTLAISNVSLSPTLANVIFLIKRNFENPFTNVSNLTR